ncbi:MAG: PAS domain S-box protein [Verrucomicrobia bacterium]|nr:PAS domain S-box protein [Verrucomicrobiota bacterium]
MKQNPDQPANAAELRGRAEERLKGQKTEGGGLKTEDGRRRTEGGGQKTELETARLVNELQVHQIELEMQNEELHQAHAKAEALLAQYTGLYDFAPTGYLTLDREGTIRQLNLTGARLLGLERSRLVNRRFGQFVAEGDRGLFRHFLEQVFASEAKADCEVTLPQAGHPPRFVQIEGARSADGQECLAVVQDHTERRQAQEQAQAAQAETQRLLALSDQSRRALLSAAEGEQEAMAALRESERSLKEAQRIARLGSYVLHIPSGLWSSSDVLDTLFGIGATYDRSVAGWEALIHPADRTMMGDYFRNEVLAQGRSFDKEYRIVRHDDQAERWVHGYGNLEFDAAGHSLNMHGTIQDVTERRQTLESLRQSEERFRRAVLDSPFPILLHAEDGSIIQSSNSWCEITGYTHEELATIADWTERAYGESKTLVQADIDRLYGLNHRVDEGDYNIHTKRGDTRIWDFSSAPLGRLPDGRRLVISMAMDVTERRAAERGLRRLNAELDQRVKTRTAQLEDANKELEAFSYSVSHDLRTPLRAIDGFARILEEEYTARLDDEGRRLLGVVCGEAKRMGQLIDDLLAFSKMSRQQAKSEPIDMTALAQEVIARCAAQAPGRQIQFQVQPLPPARGDRAMLRQVLQNLCSNAIKYTRPRAVGEIEIGGRPEGEKNLYYVKDNGVGFDMKYAGKLFGVFQRLHAEDMFEGTGVGLALVQRVIHRHDILLHPAEPATRLGQSNPQPHLMTKALRILLLEDRPTDAELVTRALRKEGIQFSAQRVMTEADFLAQLREFTPDLILADYSLPDYNGLSALAAAQREHPEVPFIFVSGELGEERAIEALRQGATDYVLKQRLSRLGAVVRRALKEQEEKNQRQQAEAKLRAAEGRYRALFDQSPDGIVIIDPATARIVDFNTTAHQQLGYSCEEFARLSVLDLEAAETSEETRERIAKVVREGHDDFETRQRTKQGELRHIHVTAQIVESAGRPIYHCIWRDITERKRAEERISQLNQLLRAMREINQIIVQQRDPPLMLADACNVLVRGRGLPLVWVGLVEHGSKRVVPVARAGEIADFLDKVTVTWDDAPTGQGPVGTAIRSGQPAICQDIATDPRFAPWRELALTIHGGPEPSTRKNSPC